MKTVSEIVDEINKNPCVMNSIQCIIDHYAYEGYKLGLNQVDSSKIIAAQDEYISLLVDEINSLIGVASVHGWRSQNVQKGEDIRKKITELKKGL